MTFFVTFVSFLFVIALLVSVHEWGHYRMATLVGVRVIRFAIGFGKPLLICTPKRQPLLDGKPQTTEFVIALLPLGGYVKMQDEREAPEPGKAQIDDSNKHQSFNRQPLWARALVVLAGPLANFVLAILLFSAVNWMGLQLPQARITQVTADSPAAHADLQAGDLVLTVGEKVITDSLQLRELIRNSDQNVTQQWQIRRGDILMTIAVTPLAVVEEDKVMGQIKVGRIGAMIGSRSEWVVVRYGLFEGVVVASQKTWEISATTLKTLGKMLTGEASLKNLTGPITVAEYSGKTAMMGITTFFLFLGLVSVSLGVLNLLPLPMLDGGHLMYYVWEFFTGKAISDWWLDKLQRMGFALLALLTTLALYNDLIRLFGLQSWLD